jgi:fatty-acid peroxygenase
MIDGAGSFGPRSWWGLLLRQRTERWLRARIEEAKRGQQRFPEGSPADTIVRHRDRRGDLLPPEIATVEIANLLRPTVAVSRFIVFIVLALREHPEYRQRLETADDADVEQFVQEVRRFYPFFPFIGGRVATPFDWHGHHFSQGDWVLLDLYGTNHDETIWEHPDAFRPERFRHWVESTFNFIPQGAGMCMTATAAPASASPSS